jgi:hypothetical protein
MITGWKEISKFFNVSIRTAKNWYYDHELPIKKTPTGRPCADPEELKNWLIETKEKRNK